MKTITNLAALACAALFISSTASAQDYVAVKVEAEDFSQKSPLWRVFSDSSTPNVNPDPDGSHHTSASGRAYVELLPDTRVTHGDSLNTGGNFWDTAGSGPSLSYIVNIPEPGRYIVFAKAYSTGTEDNGIHVGLNNQNPTSGHRMQWCNGKNRWTWSSAQRVSSNHCGVQRTIYLDIPVAGANTIVFSAREDGFELDQFMLIKEKAGGLTCNPTANDQISCNRPASGDVSENDNVNPPVTPDNNNDGNDGNDGNDNTDEDTDTDVTTQLNQCMSAASDTDGDGYGWENGQSCIASGTTQPDTNNGSGSTNTTPACATAESDHDGDGWGWENNQSCLVSGSTDTNETDSNDTPICQQASSDSDGDGWGWENSRSCIVQ